MQKNWVYILSLEYLSLIFEFYPSLSFFADGQKQLWNNSHVNEQLIRHQKSNTILEIFASYL